VHIFEIFTYKFPTKITGKNPRNRGEKFPQSLEKIPAIAGKMLRDSGKKSPRFQGNSPRLKSDFFLAAGHTGASAPGQPAE
jgi:hypothetical protein